MSDQQIPERRLGDEARARRRTELMEAITVREPRRRQWLAPVAAAVVVAGLVGGGYAVSRAGDGPGDRADDRPAEVAGSGTATSTVSPTVPPECGADITLEQLEQSLEDMARTRVWEDPVVAPVLRSYRDIVARHLDPRGEHLERRVSNVQAGGSAACGFDALGTKLGWHVAGQDGQGMVQVEVGTSRRESQIGMAFDSWPEIAVTLPPGVREVDAVTDGDRMAVLVTRTDGLVVGILADPLFGNNSLTPVSGFDFEVSDLIETAADPEFALPS